MIFTYIPTYIHTYIQSKKSKRKEARKEAQTFIEDANANALLPPNIVPMEKKDIVSASFLPEAQHNESPCEHPSCCMLWFQRSASFHLSLVTLGIHTMDQDREAVATASPSKLFTSNDEMDECWSSVLSGA